MAAGDYKRKLMDILQSEQLDEVDSTVPFSANLLETSKEVQRRIRALKKYQLETIDVESKFFERIHQLEREFLPALSMINQKRNAVVSGEYQPTDDECKIPLIHGLSEEELQKILKDAPVEGTPSKGIPDFWLHALDNCLEISDYIQEHDVPVLKYLTDVTTELYSDPNGFALLFHFAENPYFTNTVLKKSYGLKITPDEDNPFSYDGPAVVKCQGTEINWKEGKNVTQKLVKESVGGDGKMILRESFFDFFDPVLKELVEDMDSEAQDLLLADFETGQIIRDQVVPRAVLYFTGEADDADEDYDDYDDEDSSNEDGDHDKMEEE